MCDVPSNACLELEVCGCRAHYIRVLEHERKLHTLFDSPFLTHDYILNFAAHLFHGVNQP